MALLDVRGVGLSFGGVTALNDVSLSVEEGEIFSIIGPNGAGKTTLFNVISGAYTADRGEVFISDEKINQMKPADRARRGLQRTFQNLQTLHSMTAIENVMVGCHLSQNTGFMSGLLGLPSVRRETRTIELESLALLRMFALDNVRDQIAGTLPYGIQKRLEIARALAARPKVLLLDEPAAGLNGKETEELGDVIRGIVRERTTVVLVEHDMKLVMGISDRVLVLNFGRMLASGTPAAVSDDSRVIEAYLGTDIEAKDTDAP
ncbi:MAG: ABC transporter ATP-binding protein [Methylocystis sp.]